MALVVGLGSPSDSTIELIAALFPVVIGTLSLVPLYFTSSALFGRRVGLYSIVVFAVMPIHLMVSMFGAQIITLLRYYYQLQLLHCLFSLLKKVQIMMSAGNNKKRSYIMY
jgi:hypothetical protein